MHSQVIAHNLYAKNMLASIIPQNRGPTPANTNRHTATAGMPRQNTGSVSNFGASLIPSQFNLQAQQTQRLASPPRAYQGLQNSYSVSSLQSIQAVNAAVAGVAARLSIDANQATLNMLSTSAVRSPNHTYTQPFMKPPPQFFQQPQAFPNSAKAPNPMTMTTANDVNPQVFSPYNIGTFNPFMLLGSPSSQGIYMAPQYMQSIDKSTPRVPPSTTMGALSSPVQASSTNKQVILHQNQLQAAAAVLAKGQQALNQAAKATVVKQAPFKTFGAALAAAPLPHKAVQKGASTAALLKSPKSTKTAREPVAPLRDSPKRNENLKMLAFPQPLKPNAEQAAATTPKAAENKSPVTDANPSAEKTWSLDDFDMIQMLGIGRFGQVYMAKEKISQRIVSLKLIMKEQLNTEKLKNQIKHEIEIHAKLQHTNVLKMFGYFWDPKRICLILECIDQGDLYKELQSQPTRKFTEKKSANYIKQIALGLQYLHSKGVVHRDLKPENLLNDKGTIKLTDFGWSAMMATQDKRKSICGTVDYLPPEMIEGKEYDAAVDVWSLGVLTFEFLTGHPPFETATEYQTYMKIAKVDILWDFAAGISVEARDFIGKLLKYQAKDRMSLADALTHPWIVLNASN